MRWFARFALVSIVVLALAGCSLAPGAGASRTVTEREYLDLLQRVQNAENTTIKQLRVDVSTGDLAAVAKRRAELEALQQELLAVNPPAQYAGVQAALMDYYYELIQSCSAFESKNAAGAAAAESRARAAMGRYDSALKAALGVK